MCLALHPNGHYVVSGQKDPKGATKPKICVWDSATMETLVVLEHHERGVCCVGFSPDGKTLVTVGCDDNHSVAVWDWHNNTKTPVFEYCAIKEELYEIFASYSRQ